MAIPIQFRRGTAEEWASVDPILFEGELGLLVSDDPDNQLMKMGDGILKWSELPWALRGPRGFDFVYEWDGTTLKVKHSDEAEFIGVNLKGETGDTGAKGDKGDAPEHEWSDTSLRFKNVDGSWGGLIELKGVQGIQGIQGLQGIQGEKGDTGEKGETGNPADLAEGKMWVGNASGVAEEVTHKPVYLGADISVRPDAALVPNGSLFIKYKA